MEYAIVVTIVIAFTISNVTGHEQQPTHPPSYPGTQTLTHSPPRHPFIHPPSHRPTLAHPNAHHVAFRKPVANKNRFSKVPPFSPPPNAHKSFFFSVFYRKPVG